MKLNGKDIYLSFLKGQGFEHQGEYDNTAVYEKTSQKIDCVSYEGTSYYCKKTTTAGIDPTNTEYWGVLAQSGSGSPDEYVKKATVSDNLLILTNQDDENVTFEGGGSKVVWEVWE